MDEPVKTVIGIDSTVMTSQWLRGGKAPKIFNFGERKSGDGAAAKLKV
jgi:hypothetical protein